EGSGKTDVTAQSAVDHQRIRSDGAAIDPPSAVFRTESRVGTGQSPLLPPAKETAAQPLPAGTDTRATSTVTVHNASEHHLHARDHRVAAESPLRLCARGAPHPLRERRIIQRPSARRRPSANV